MRQWAFTPPGDAPAYINFTELDDGSFSVTVRSPAKPDGSLGDGGTITMSRDDFVTFMQGVITEAA